MQLLCVGLNGFGSPTHNASLVSLSFGMENAGLRMLDAGIALLRRNMGPVRLNAGCAHLKGDISASVWHRKLLGLLI